MSASSLLIRWTAIAALVAGCGGGGDAGGQPTPPAAVPPAVPAAPTLSIGFAHKRFDFQWAAVAGATHYRLHVDVDGRSGFTPIGTDIAAPATASSLDVAAHLLDWPNVRYRLQACNAAGCGAPSNEVGIGGGAALAAVGYLKASNTGAGDAFGNAVALSADGNTLAVAAANEDSIGSDPADNSAGNAGAVYVFVRSAGVWAQQAYLKASNAQAADGFGSALAISADGNTLAVGTPGEDSNATGIGGNQGNDGAANAGAVYVFSRTGGSWSQQAYLKASNTGAGDRFGSALAISGSGNLLAVGASGEDSATTGIGGNQADDSAANAGAVYIFSRDFATWSQRVYLKASNTGVGDNFGISLALSGDGSTLAVGASGEDSASAGVGGDQADNSAASAGAVYVFRQAAGVWTQQAYVKAAHPGADDFFGASVALNANGSVLAVGAPTESSAATGINGDSADDSAKFAGAVYVFARNGTNWSQQAYLKASNTDSDDRFGFALAFNGNGDLLAVGAVLEDSSDVGVGGSQTDAAASQAGAVYVFARSGAAWSQQAYVKATNTGHDDLFGYAAALSADGRTLVVGAAAEFSAATGFGGDANDNTAPLAGAVYVY